MGVASLQSDACGGVQMGMGHLSVVWGHLSVRGRAHGDGHLNVKTATFPDALVADECIDKNDKDNDCNYGARAAATTSPAPPPA